MLTQASVVSEVATERSNRFCFVWESRGRLFTEDSRKKKKKKTLKTSIRSTNPTTVISFRVTEISLCINWSPSPSHPLFCTLYCVRFFLSPSCYGYKPYQRLELTRAEAKEHYLNCGLQMQPQLFVNKMQCLQWNKNVLFIMTSVCKNGGQGWQVETTCAGLIL